MENECFKACHPVFGRSIMYNQTDVKKFTPIRQGPKKAFGTVTGEQVVENSETRGKGPDSKGVGQPTSRKCLNCKGEHRLAHCRSFGNLPHSDKMEFAKTNKLCFKCLRSGHFGPECQRVEKCRRCEREHPTVMHIEGNTARGKMESVEPEPKGSKDIVKIGEEASNALSTDKSESCTLAIIPIKISVKGSHKVIETLAFLDPGSTATFCSEGLMNKLNCSGKKVRYKLETPVGSQEVTSHVIKD